MDQDRLGRMLALVILFLLATTLFNTLRANRVEKRTTSFRKHARYELKIMKLQLQEQEETNAYLLQQLGQVLAEQSEGSLEK